MQRPKGFGGDGSLWERQHHGSDLPQAVVAFVIAAHQSGSVKGEQQPILVEEVKRGKAVALALVDGARSEESKRPHRNLEGWWLRRSKGGLGFRLGRMLLIMGEESALCLLPGGHAKPRRSHEPKARSSPKSSPPQAGREKPFHHHQLFSPIPRSLCRDRAPAMYATLKKVWQRMKPTTGVPSDRPPSMGWLTEPPSDRREPGALCAGWSMGWLTGVPSDRSSSMGWLTGVPSDRSWSMGWLTGVPSDRSSSMGWLTGASHFSATAPARWPEASGARASISAGSRSTK